MESSHRGYCARTGLTRRLDDLLWRRDFDSAEFLMGVVSMIWGTWLLNPYWNSFASTPSYAALAVLAPEWLAGLAMLTVGVAQILALIFDVRSWRRATALIMVAFWMFLSMTLGYANIASTAGPVYLAFALAEMWAFVRLGRMHQT